MQPQVLIEQGEATLRGRYSGSPIECTNLTGSPVEIAVKLQSCLDSAPEFATVELPPGVYQVARVITIHKPLRLVTKGLGEAAAPCGKNVDGRCAVIRAHSSTDPILRGFILIAADNVTLDHIVVDGNKAQRAKTPEAAQCSSLSNNGAGFNIEARRDSVAMIGMTSMNALCGTGAEVAGAKLWVTGSSFIDNGVHQIQNMWADGLTVISSANATVAGNTFVDNTDVNLIFGACTDCNILQNTIVHTGTFAGSSFAGLMLQAWPGGTSGDYSGSTIANNTINCANNRCGFGLLLGSAPWGEAPMQGGFVSRNFVEGAQIGFLVNNATNPQKPVQIGPNHIVRSGGVFLTNLGMRAVPAIGMSQASRQNVVFVQGASAAQFMDVDLSGAILNTWKKDTITSFSPNTTSNDISYLAAKCWMESATLFTTGQGVRSYGGAYGLILQTDGNLVLYGPYGPVWSSKTAGSAAIRLAMQEDGNLVLYTSNSVPVWSTGTYGNRGARLAVQDDGNLVLYAVSGKPLWKIK